MASVADIVVETLDRHGVTHVFGVPGDAINALVDALRRADGPDFLTVRHEEAGAFAASAQAKLTGNLAACAGTAGPGAVHLLNGLIDAAKDGAPVLAITGQVSTAEMGSDYHQEVDLKALFSAFAVSSQTVMSPEQAPRLVAEACHLALTRRGVAHIAIPLDIAGKEAPEAYYIPRPKTTRVAADTAIADAAEEIAACEKVAILAGNGCRHAVEELRALAERLQAPIIKALGGKDILPFDDPFNIGGLGMLGGKPGVEAVHECDGLILAGTDFPYRDFLPEAKTVVQIDIDPDNIGRRCPVTVGLCGDAKETIRSLLEKLEDDRKPDFLDDMRKQRADWIEWLEKGEDPKDEPVAPGYLARMAGDLADDDAIFVCDTGEVTVWTARHLRMRKNQRFTLSASLASMAYGLPGAIGASLAYPDRQVVALCGDGGFSMLMPDFLTAVKCNLPLTAIVFNNAKLGLIEVEQEAEALPSHAVDLDNPDFAAFARLCGGDGYRVEKPGDLEGAIKAAYAGRRPAVIDVLIDRDRLPLPPEISLGQAYHFGLAKMRETFATITKRIR